MSQIVIKSVWRQPEKPLDCAADSASPPGMRVLDGAQDLPYLVRVGV